MKNKTDLSFSFTQSDLVVSGVAIKKGEDIVASFKLEAKGNSINSQTDPEYYSIELRMVFKPAEKELYAIFDDVFWKIRQKQVCVCKGGISFFPLENLSQRYEKSNRGSKRNVEKKPT